MRVLLAKMNVVVGLKHLDGYAKTNADNPTLKAFSLQNLSPLPIAAILESRISSRS
jgi:hypothetical protein